MPDDPMFSRTKKGVRVEGPRLGYDEITDMIDKDPDLLARLHSFVTTRYQQLQEDPAFQAAWQTVPFPGGMARYSPKPIGNVNDMLQSIRARMAMLLQGKAPVKEADPNIVRQMRAKQNVSDYNLPTTEPVNAAERELVARDVTAHDAVRKALDKASHWKGRSSEAYSVPQLSSEAHGGLRGAMQQPMFTIKSDNWHPITSEFYYNLPLRTHQGSYYPRPSGIDIIPPP